MKTGKLKSGRRIEMMIPDTLNPGKPKKRNPFEMSKEAFLKKYIKPLLRQAWMDQRNLKRRSVMSMSDAEVISELENMTGVSARPQSDEAESRNRMNSEMLDKLLRQPSTAQHFINSKGNYCMIVDFAVERDGSFHVSTESYKACLDVSGMD